MSSNLMPERDAVLVHLTNFNQQPRIRFFSGFVAALRDARKFTKRNQENGQKLMQDNCGDHGSWLGAIGYLSLLDQIGKCFKPRAVALVQGNSIKQALKHFTALPDLHIDALYALRNAFAHDYGLNNVNHARPTLTHNFTVLQSPAEPIVVLPPNAWDGDYATRNAGNVTKINLEAIGDLVEAIHIDMLQYAQTGDLEVLLPGGSDELLSRYSFYAM